MLYFQLQLLRSDVDAVTTLITQGVLFLSLFGIILTMLSSITTQFGHQILNEELVIVLNPTKDLTKVQHYLTKHFHQDSVVCSPGSNDNEYFVIFTYTIDANRKTIRESIRTILEPFSTT